MIQDYEVLVDGKWLKVQAESVSEAAEVGVVKYDEESSALACENKTVEVYVRNPQAPEQTFRFLVNCTLRPFYQLA